MTGFARMRLYFVIAATVWSGPQALDAASITYSWSGSLVLANDSQPDPWGIGDDGAQFTMSTTVDGGAIDWDVVQTDVAVFSAANARLWVDGQEALLIGAPSIDFTDTMELPYIDIVTMAGNFSLGGQVVGFGTVVALSPLTYSFHSLIEVPPLFSSMPTVSRGGFVFYPYAAIVPGGTLISVVPEPSAWALAVIGILGCEKRRQ